MSLFDEMGKDLEIMNKQNVEDAENLWKMGHILNDTEVTAIRPPRSKGYAVEEPTNNNCSIIRLNTNSVCEQQFTSSGFIRDIQCERDKILKAIKSHQVIIIEGKTGCGKTTKVPQFILDDSEEKNTYCNIIVTQPRKLAATTVAHRIANERKSVIGSLVGYRVGLMKCVSSTTKLTFATVGVLLHRLLSKKSLSHWTHIIIDEAHERDLDTDMLLLDIKNIILETKNHTTKIILMSATLNSTKFLDYFCSPNSNLYGTNLKLESPHGYPVKEIYLDDFTDSSILFNLNESPQIKPEYCRYAAKQIQNLDGIEKNDVTATDNNYGSRGAVLVFLPGVAEIEMFHDMLQDFMTVKKTSTNYLKWQILPLHASMDHQDQERCFAPVQEGYRKIILATNIAESSITVPDIKYVFDFCIKKSMSVDESTNFAVLKLEWASKNDCTQRKGRCGRVSPGVYYALVTRKIYNSLNQETLPEMLKCSLDAAILHIKMLEMGSPVSIFDKALDSPHKSLIAKGVVALKQAGALSLYTQYGDSYVYDDYNGEITSIGQIMAKLPVDIRLGRLILLGYCYDLLDQATVIAAGLSVKSPFSCPTGKCVEAYLSKLNWANNTFSDCIAILNLYKTWCNLKESNCFDHKLAEENWAQQHFVNISSLQEMKCMIEEIYQRLKTCGLQVPSLTAFNEKIRSSEDQLILLQIVISGAFYPLYFSGQAPKVTTQKNDLLSFNAMSDDNWTCSVLFEGFPREQPVELYRNKIRQALSDGTNLPFLTFRNKDEILVTFDPRGNNLGQICPAVYRCMKQRDIKDLISLKLPSYLDAIVMINDGYDELNQRLANNIPCPSQVVMPGLKIKHLDASITNISNPANFYIVLKDYEDDLNLIRTQLDHIWQQSACQQLEMHYCYSTRFCLAFYKEKLHRARIETDIKDYKVLVFLIDTGISVTIKVNNLYAVYRHHHHFSNTNAWLTKPALAIKCRLQGVGPPTRNGSVWSLQCVEFFKSYSVQNDNRVCLNIYSVVDCVIVAKLTKHTTISAAPTLNDLLKEKNFADTWPEPIPSRDNHYHRQNAQENTWVHCLNDFLESIQNKPEHPYNDPILYVSSSSYEFDELECEKKVILKGPTNPLEINFSAMCKSMRSTRVLHNRGNSVNCVVLDHQLPLQSVPRLLVAGKLSILEKSGHIMIRETTLMPAIPDLFGLLSLLFAPNSQLCANQDQTTYSGGVFGLGFDPVQQKSLYPEHDIEYTFETSVDANDVATVKSIRLDKYKLLSNFTLDADVVFNLQTSIRNKTIAYLDRTRKSVTQITTEEQF